MIYSMGAAVHILNNWACIGILIQVSRYFQANISSPIIYAYIRTSLKWIS